MNVRVQGPCALFHCKMIETLLPCDKIDWQTDRYMYIVSEGNVVIFSLSYKEFICHEGGASAIAFSSNEQRLISGGRRGEICIQKLIRSH